MNLSTYKPGSTWWLFALLAFMLFFRLGVAPIYILDETKNAECAREMMQRHDYITPVFDGELRTDKPPLHYFFMIAAYKVFGTTAFAARFFSGIMGILTVLITFIYTKRLVNAFTAFCSALVLVTSPHFLFEFRLAVPDPYLIFFVALGIFSGFTWLHENNIKQLYITAAALGLATLAKGPVALALPGLCLLIWVIAAKKWSTVFTWHLVPAFLLLGIITVPWYYAVDKATNGAWTKGFFIDNNLNRFSDPQEGHGGFFLITILFIMVGLLPFVSFIGEAIKQRSKVLSQPLVRFGAVVVAAFAVFFSISSTKLPNYPMPCYPFAAVVLGAFIAKLLSGEAVSKKYPWYILLLFTMVIPVAGFFTIQQEVETATVKDAALWLLPATFIFIGASFIKTGWPEKIGIIAIAFSVFNIIGLQFLYPALYEQNPVSKTIDMVKQSPNVYAYSIFNPAYRFYLDKDIPRTFDASTLQHWLDSSGNNSIVITRTDYLDSLKGLSLTEISRHHDIFELPTTVILQYHAKP